MFCAQSASAPPGKQRPTAAGNLSGQQTHTVTEPQKDDETNNLHPGQHDEGGHGGMATREHDAHEAEAAGDDARD